VSGQVVLAGAILLTFLLQGHHRDYQKPLVAEWYCQVCHYKKHSPRFQGGKNGSEEERRGRESFLAGAFMEVLFSLEGGVDDLPLRVSIRIFHPVLCSAKQGREGL